MVILLALYGVRRRLPYPPLLDASSWLQGHIWLGLATLALFPIHAGFDWPSGLIESMLAALFLLTAASGVFGILISRFVPKRLTLLGHEVIYERIPTLRRRLSDEARGLVEAAAKSGGEDATTLAGFWETRLAGFFAEQRHRSAHLRQSRRPLHSLRHELEALERYLAEAERQVVVELYELIEAKNALDYHAAMQGLLKGWLLLHIPITAALLVFALAHAVLVQGLPAGWS